MKNNNEQYNQLWSFFDSVRGTFQLEEVFPLIIAATLVKSCSENETMKIPVKAEWSYLVSKAPGLKGLEEALGLLESKNELLSGIMDYFKFDENHYSKNIKIRDALIEKIIILIDGFKFENNEERRLLIAMFVHNYQSQMGKKHASEFSTPSSLNKLSQVLIDLNSTDSVYDPCFGICTFFDYPESGIKTFEGHEINPHSRGLAIALHVIVGYKKFNITLGDSLVSPLVSTDNRMKQFDKIVSFPPFNLDFGKNYQQLESWKNDKWNRFKLGSSSDGNWMFVQHIISCLNPKGKAVLTLPLGALFKIGVNKEIRQGLIEQGFIEAVIQLPDRLFYNTGIPCCMLILSKIKNNDEKVMFIKADGLGKVQGSNRVLTDEDIEKLVLTYKNREEIEGFSRLVSFQEIATNDHNILPNRYITETHEVQVVNVAQICEEMSQSNQIAELSKMKVEEILRELGLWNKNASKIIR